MQVQNFNGYNPTYRTATTGQPGQQQAFQPAENAEEYISSQQSQWGPDPITPIFNAIATGVGVVAGTGIGAAVGHFGFQAGWAGAAVGAVGGGVAAYVWAKNFG